MSSPIIVAHRGLHVEYPENSLGAFRAARRAGFDWVEFDIQKSADGEPVIIHDPTLDRTTLSCGPVAALPAAELEKIHLKNARGEAHWCKVPILREVGGGNRLVEIKPLDDAALVRNVMQVLRQSPGQWMIQSFDPRNVIHAWAVDPAAQAALLIGNTQELEQAMAERWPAIHLDHVHLTPHVHRELRGRGTSIGVWTVNEEPDIRRMLKLGVDMIITDEPKLVAQLAAPPKIE